MKILGINISHNGSSCLLEDGEIVYFIEDERLCRIKQYGPSIHDIDRHIFVFVENIKKYTNYVDYIIFCSSGRDAEPNSLLSDEAIVEFYLNSFTDNKITFGEYIFDKTKHHLYHAANGFYGSGYNSAVCLILDGGGSLDYSFNLKSREYESIFEFSYDNSYKKLKQLKGIVDETFESRVIKDGNNVIADSYSNGQLFNIVSYCVGFSGGSEAGKTMGLSCYSKELPTKFEFEEINWFENIDGEWITSEKLKKILKNLHSNNNSIFDRTDFEGENFYIKANLCKKLQDETLEHTRRLINQALSLSKSKNIVISGGYALNCLNNYKYLENLPQDVNLFIDPISNDAGTSLGAAKLLWYELTKSKKKIPLKTLYLG